ncbi:SRPBCC domain-containing protein [uncultured Marivirga sp.]|uniref:SRPBCC family protein n=1 Tax=uncultured Marivirga sp. TaxID=1123707 RepID=UPI0030EF5351|tara:strand:- start:19596 stop:20090 length:495 start_codon:yes stop_codon:yes gene_type:complete
MNNWNTFSKRIIISKSVDLVYQCWATQSKIEKWFLESASFNFDAGQRTPDDFVQKGDTFTWKWNNWDFTEKGDILEANGKDLISFTFGTGGTVTIQLNEIDGKTEVILTQNSIPTDEKSKMEIYVGCSTGWTFWLTNLKAFLEYGITLHAKGLKQEETRDLVNS